MLQGYILIYIVRNMVKAIKAKPMLIKLRKDLDSFLRKEAKRSGKTMVLILEELLEYRRRFKTFPPSK